MKSSSEVQVHIYEREMSGMGAVWVRPKSYIASAIQVIDENIDDLLHLDELDETRNINVVKDLLTGGVIKVEIKTKGNKRFIPVNPGYWILRDSEGYFTAMSDKAFWEMYEPVHYVEWSTTTEEHESYTQTIYQTEFSEERSG